MDYKNSKYQNHTKYRRILFEFIIVPQNSGAMNKMLSTSWVRTNKKDQIVQSKIYIKKFHQKFIQLNVNIVRRTLEIIWQYKFFKSTIMIAVSYEYVYRVLKGI